MARRGARVRARVCVFLPRWAAHSARANRGVSRDRSYLPHSFLATDYERRGPALCAAHTDLHSPSDGCRDSARSAAGLPSSPSVVVFADFNAPAKLDPAAFDAWCHVLRRVRGSLLLLLRPRSPAAAERLRFEAAARGVHPSRVRFAPMLPLPAHLARVAGAVDVVLDTRLCVRRAILLVPERQSAFPVWAAHWTNAYSYEPRARGCAGAARYAFLI